MSELDSGLTAALLPLDKPPQIDGDCYRMRGHRAKLAQLRAGMNTINDRG